MTDIININTAKEILRRFGPDPDPDLEDDATSTFWESLCEAMLKQEEKWRQRRQTFAWVDQRPNWLSVTSWECADVLGYPDKPYTRTFRLSLLGGGQIKVMQDFVPMGSPWHNDVICYKPRLRVQAATDEGLRTADAVIDGPCYEMSANAVVFSGRVPQAIADRTAVTLRLIDFNTDNFVALLARSNRCCCCGRPLKDEVSKLLSIGPNCAKAMRLPHNAVAASRVLARRRELLGDES